MNLRAYLANKVHEIWRNNGCISTVLLPLSWITRIAVRQKSARYKRQPHRIWHSRLPVVVVGNIYVGGTGKTPVVMALVDALTQRGWRPGVISRGYGARIGKQARTGHGRIDPARFGDEPALIASTTGVPIAVHPSRPIAAQALMRDYPQVDVIVADDGLQHLALGRDAEVIVQDGRGIGNGRLLPAGPLREPVAKLAEVDVLVTNGPLTVGERRTNGSRADRAGGERPVRVTMTLVPEAVIQVSTGRSHPWADWLAKRSDATLSAVAAIGHPERFFEMLRSFGLELEHTLALPDHTGYSQTTFNTIRSDMILVTTKDAVKCATLNDDRLWAVHVVPHFSHTDWLDQLHETLATAAVRKSSNANQARR